MEIQFMHAGIQPCNSNAQISMNNLLIPRYNEDSGVIRYQAIHCYVQASDIDCFNRYFRRWIPFQANISLALSTTNSPTKKVRSQRTPWKYIHQFEREQDSDENSTANLKDLIAATGLLSCPNKIKIVDFFSVRETLNFDIENNREPVPCL